MKLTAILKETKSYITFKFAELEHAVALKLQSSCSAFETIKLTFRFVGYLAIGALLYYWLSDAPSWGSIWLYVWALLWPLIVAAKFILWLAIILGAIAAIIYVGWFVIGEERRKRLIDAWKQQTKKPNINPTMILIDMNMIHTLC